MRCTDIYHAVQPRRGGEDVTSVNLMNAWIVENLRRLDDAIVNGRQYVEPTLSEVASGTAQDFV